MLSQITDPPKIEQLETLSTHQTRRIAILIKIILILISNFMRSVVYAESVKRLSSFLTLDHMCPQGRLRLE
jgi:hypothetical protein